MGRPIKIIDDPFEHLFSEMIDVRSPTEFAEDHIEGAVNLPVLSDEERVRVGTIYKQESAFRGRKVGAGLVSMNIGRMVAEHFEAKDESFRPLIYCARGGHRSRSLATVLAEIGFEVSLLRGGYKNYRALIRERLPLLPKRHRFLVLTGLTGCGKSKVLDALEAVGEQVLHLEKLASHQGSLLGSLPGNLQPTQKRFESLLFSRLSSFEPQRVVWVEAESQKIGEVFIPSMLHDQMRASASIEIEVPMEERVRFLIEQYPHFTNDPELLKRILAKLKALYGNEVIERWGRLIDSREWETLVTELLRDHYDPRYRSALERNYNQRVDSVSMASLSRSGILDAVQRCLLNRFAAPLGSSIQCL